MTASLLQLRSLELGIKKTDMCHYSCGQIFGILIEKGNDQFEYPLKASQADINKLFPR